MIKTLTDQVEYILTTVPDSRNSDITLTIELWKHYNPGLVREGKDGRHYIAIETMFDLPREDAIKRVRAKIQNEQQRYLPTELKIFMERARLSDEWKVALGYSPNLTQENWENKLKMYYSVKTGLVVTPPKEENWQERRKREEREELEATQEKLL